MVEYIDNIWNQYKKGTHEIFELHNIKRNNSKIFGVFFLRIIWVKVKKNKYNYHSRRTIIDIFLYIYYDGYNKSLRNINSLINNSGLLCLYT